MTWLDLEGTVIDNLSNRNWLDKGQIVIPHTEFGIFTWGWWDESEIDWNLIHAIEERFSDNVIQHKCVKVLTKKDCMNWMFNHKLWFFDGWDNNFSNYRDGEKFNSFLQCMAEESFNEKFTKETCFIEMFKDEKYSWLFDDTIKEDKKIIFLDTDNTIVLFNPMKE